MTTKGHTVSWKDTIENLQFDKTVLCIKKEVSDQRSEKMHHEKKINEMYL